MLRKLALGLLLAWPCSAYSMVAPWYQFTNKARALLAGDKCLQIAMPVELEPQTSNDPHIALPIAACSLEKAQAIAKLLTEPAAQISVRLDLQGPDGQPIEQSWPEELRLNQLITTVDDALKGNPFYVKASTRQAPWESQSVLFVEFKPLVAQWYVDDISDLYGFHSQTAALAFADLLNVETFRTRGLDVRVTSMVSGK